MSAASYARDFAAWARRRREGVRRYACAECGLTDVDLVEEAGRLLCSRCRTYVVAGFPPLMLDWIKCAGDGSPGGQGGQGTG